MKNIFEEKNKGFVALFTVLIATVVLSMAVGISNIALKQIVLTASASDANKSFYAADTGIECALYHDMTSQVFDPILTNTETITCGMNNITIQNQGQGNFLEFSLPVGENQENCAYIKVNKTAEISPYTAVITSRGVNVPCDNSDLPRKVERAIEVTY